MSSELGIFFFSQFVIPALLVGLAHDTPPVACVSIRQMTFDARDAVKIFDQTMRNRVLPGDDPAFHRVFNRAE
jgi:hypothetical protein